MDLTKQIQNIPTKYFFWLIVIFGLSIKFYFIFFKDLNVDQLVFIGFVKDPSWGSIFWDNYPPLPHTLGKLVVLLGFDFLKSMRIFIFIVAAIGFLIFSKQLFKRFGFLPTFLYAVFPVSLVDATVIRPVFLIEFFSILTLHYYLNYIEEKQSRWNYLGLLTSSILLLLTSYTAVLLFFFLGLLGATAKTKLFDKRSMTNKEIYVFLLIFAGALATTFFIRWPSLYWISSEISFLDSIQASFLWVRNLFGYSWFIFSSALVVFIMARAKLPIIFLAIIFSINPILQKAAIEPRFIFCVTPLLFFEFVKSFQIIGQKKMRFVFACLLIFFSVWHSAWFLVNDRSSIESASVWTASQGVNSFIPGLSRSSYFALDSNIPVLSGEQLKQAACPLTSALIMPTHAKAYINGEVLENFKSMGLEVKSEKLFDNSVLEKIHVYIFEKQCQN
jgi:hypothetical protein